MSDESKISKHQSFTIQRLNRNQVKKCEYNPRAISPSAKKLLKDNLQRVGLVEPLIVNTTTMNLVSGHQRIEILDALAGTNDYYLDFSTIEVSDKEEVELNIWLNNELGQGFFEDESLAKAMKLADYSPHTGFDDTDVTLMWGETESPFAKEAIVRIQNDVERLNRLNPPEVAKNPDKKPEVLQNPYTGEESSRKSVAGAVAEIVEAANEKDYYLYLVFRNNAEREEFLHLMGEKEDQKHVNGRRFLETLRAEAKNAPQT